MDHMRAAIRTALWIAFVGLFTTGVVFGSAVLFVAAGAVFVVVLSPAERG